MSFALRGALLLAATLPLFAATAFHPAWWQTLIAAAIGSALGQIAVRVTRGRRVVAWTLVGVATIIAAGAAVWSVTPGELHAAAPGLRILVLRSQPGVTPPLTWDDLHALQAELAPHLVAPYLHKSSQLASEDQNWNTDVVGATPEYLELRGMHVAVGSGFAASAPPERVVVLGETVAKQLFGEAKSPLGETVRIRNLPYTVIGVLAHQGLSPQGQDFDDVALLPIDVYTAKIESRQTFAGIVLVSLAPHDDTAAMETAIRALLRDRHHLDSGADFVIRVPDLDAN